MGSRQHLAAIARYRCDREGGSWGRQPLEAATARRCDRRHAAADGSTWWCGAVVGWGRERRGAGGAV